MAGLKERDGVELCEFGVLVVERWYLYLTTTNTTTFFLLLFRT